MGFGKLWIPLFCLILIFGFLLIRGGTADLQEKTDALKTVGQKAETLLKEWKESFAKQTAVPAQSTVEEEPAGEPKPAKADPPFSCVLRAENGKIGIFTPEGYPIRYLNADLRTLPPADVAALEAGILINSRAELLERMEDLGE